MRILAPNDEFSLLVWTGPLVACLNLICAAQHHVRASFVLQTLVTVAQICRPPADAQDSRCWFLTNSFVDC